MEPNLTPGAGHEKSFKFIINGATQLPDGVRLGPSECQLTGRNLMVRPNPGQGTKQFQLREITGVERHTGLFARKRLVVKGPSSALVIWCGDKDEVLDIAAMVESAMEGA